MDTTIDNQVAIIEKSVDIFKSAGKILNKNRERSEKALDVGRRILTAIQAEGMTPELDKRAMNYLANINKALPEMKEARSGVTQIMDELRKMYTQIENELDTKKAGSIPALVQQCRDDYSKELHQEQMRKQQEAEREAKKKTEALNLKYVAENRLLNYYNDYLLASKKSLQEIFNAITLKNFESKTKQLCDFSFVYPSTHLDAFNANLSSFLLSKDELRAIAEEAMQGKFTDFSANFKAEIISLKQDLIDKLPSKKAELEAISKAADAEEKKRLAAAQKKREGEDALRLQQEAEDSRVKAEQEMELQKQGEQTMLMFNKEAALSEVEPAPETRQGYNISVLHNAAYVQLFTLWYEKCGKDLPTDKIERTDFGQIKKWCENYAHKNDTQIESKFLKYEASYRAINKKTK